VVVQYTDIAGESHKSTVYTAGKAGTQNTKEQTDAFLTKFQNGTTPECWYQMKATYKVVLETQYICSGHGTWDGNSKTCTCDTLRRGPFCEENVPPDSGSDSVPTRTYFISIEEVEWDYAPLGYDLIMNTSFSQSMKGMMHNPSMWVEKGTNRIGRVYKKAIFQGYTDVTFTNRVKLSDDWKHLGLLGPVIRAEVGDRIKVTLKNNASRPYSLHPHGVLYTKKFEGAGYQNNVNGPGNRVNPGEVYTYIWEVPERAGPGPQDPSSVGWFYHSHIDEGEDVNSGLLGPIIITRKGQTTSAGNLRPKDVDREIISFFTIFDENLSWYLRDNMKKIPEIKIGTQPMAGMKRAVPMTDMTDMPQDTDDDLAEYIQKTNTLMVDPMFKMSNMMYTINGFVYGNIQGVNMNQNERVRWYVMALGTEQDLHGAHWHGTTLLYQGMRIDSIELMPGSAKTLDMTPDVAGTWLFHCHTSHHIHGGMVGLFNVKECADCTSRPGTIQVRDYDDDETGSRMWIVYTISSLCSISVFSVLVIRYYLRKHNLSFRTLTRRYRLLKADTEMGAVSLRA